jgi:Zn-dependent protease
MFGDINQRTPLDLNFSLFRVPIRVHPLHWLFSALLGQAWFQEGGFVYLLIWIACVFVSVLLHEMGHVLMGRVFGSNGHILLYSFGGLAIGSNDLRNRWHRILVLAAGPGIQLVLYALLVVVTLALLPNDLLWLGGIAFPAPWSFTPVTAAVSMLLIINLWWPILNLLPVWPLDGGQITRELMEAARPADGKIIALAISALVAGLLAISVAIPYENRRHMPILQWLPPVGSLTGLFFLLLCVNSLMQLYAENQRRRQLSDDDQRFPWER